MTTIPDLKALILKTLQSNEAYWREKFEEKV